jgi:hypothetical protein
MASERVLADPLSGEEVRIAILDQLMTRLAKDGFLNKAHAYSHFSAKVSIHIELHDLGRVDVVDVTETATPIKADDENAALDQFDAELAIEPGAPNDVRVETGQDVPVLTQGSEGKKTIKGIRYSRKTVAKK